MESSKKFVEKVFKDINTLRTKPPGLNKQFESIIQAVSLFKGQESFIRDIQKYMVFLNTAQPISPLTMNQGLCELATKQIEIFQENDSISKNIHDEILRSRANEYVEGFNRIVQIVDDGSQDAENVIGRILFSKTDREKKNRKIIMDDGMRHIGIAHTFMNDDNVVVIVMVDKCTIKSKQKQVEKVPDDLTELKMAFDLFDINHHGRIDPKETVSAMRTLGYDTKNPTLFQIMEELATPENTKTGVDFNTFVQHITDRVENTQSEDGLRRIFNLFIDDPTQDTITLATLKKICVELEENITAEELKELLNRGAVNGNEFTFEEFYDFMTTKYKG